MGDLNERSERWGAPRTQSGQYAAEQVGEMLLPAVEAVSHGYDALFGPGPLAQTVKGRVGQATEAVGAVVGGGLLGRQVANAGRATLATRRAQQAAELGARIAQRDPGLVAAHYGIEVSPTELQAVRPGAEVPRTAQFAERA